jgi:hypothetical protein
MLPLSLDYLVSAHIILVMITITQAHTTSTASPAAIFARWADVARWPEWNSDIEWVRLEGPFAQGSTGALKPRGGPRVRFVIDRLVPGREFVDVSKLFGARLSFAHTVAGAGEGGSTIEVEVTIAGPLAPLWRRVLGSGLRASAQPDLERLVAAAEAAR